MWAKLNFANYKKIYVVWQVNVTEPPILYDKSDEFGETTFLEQFELDLEDMEPFGENEVGCYK